MSLSYYLSYHYTSYCKFQIQSDTLISGITQLIQMLKTYLMSIFEKVAKFFHSVKEENSHISQSLINFEHVLTLGNQLYPLKWALMMIFSFSDLILVVQIASPLSFTQCSAPTFEGEACSMPSLTQSLVGCSKFFFFWVINCLTLAISFLS